MSSILRSRVALVAMMGAFLIPIGMSSLRGLTHVLTCKKEAQTPFTIILEEGQPPTFLSSTGVITADEEEKSERVCGGLELDLGVSQGGKPDAVRVHVPITNTGTFEWRGTVALKAGKTTIPVDIGSIKPGVTEKDTVQVSLRRGSTQLNGSLLIGP